jgi:Transposase domain (DUF772)
MIAASCLVISMTPSPAVFVTHLLQRPGPCHPTLYRAKNGARCATPWRTFGLRLELRGGARAQERKSDAVRKPYDAIPKFKILLLQSPYNLSDEQTELMNRRRLSLMRFLGLGLGISRNLEPRR